MQITPAPNDEEAAAIAAAYQVLVLSAGGEPEGPSQAPAWRFSGRWWNQRF